MIVLTANICFDGFGGSVFEDQVDHFSVDKVTAQAYKMLQALTKLARSQLILKVKLQTMNNVLSK